MGRTYRRYGPRDHDEVWVLVRRVRRCVRGCQGHLTQPRNFIALGTDNTKVGQYPSEYWNAEEPEPYKGWAGPFPVPGGLGRILMHFRQGAFIGDETIKMESGRRSWLWTVELPYLFPVRRVVGR